ncbi:MAG: nicotinamide mononucleotide transporter [Bacteroidales bacterium]|nr:nicotinamide mononucleotide transporter [Bacteroidales bacterium]
MADFLASHWLDAFTTLLGLLYIWLEYRAHIALWIVGIIMPALDVWLYYSHGLYGDAGMAVYYTLAAVYGYAVWKTAAWKARRNNPDMAAGNVKKELPITHMPLKRYLPVGLCFLAIWGATWYVLVTWTNSTVPVLDAFTNALSIVGLWALSRKYIEQWFFWIVVDLVCTLLYVRKGIPFKALLYGLYVVIACLGWRKWLKMMKPPVSLAE